MRGGSSKGTSGRACVCTLCGCVLGALACERRCRPRTRALSACDSVMCDVRLRPGPRTRGCPGLRARARLGAVWVGPAPNFGWLLRAPPARRCRPADPNPVVCASVLRRGRGARMYVCAWGHAKPPAMSVFASGPARPGHFLTRMCSASCSWSLGAARRARGVDGRWVFGEAVWGLLVRARAVPRRVSWSRAWRGRCAA